MKYYLSFLILIMSQNLFAKDYNIDCRSERHTSFYSSIIISGDLTTHDYDHDGFVDHITGNLEIEFPYLNHSIATKVDGPAHINDYINYQSLYAKAVLIHNDNALGNLIEINEDQFNDQTGSIRIFRDFDIYECSF